MPEGVRKKKSELTADQNRLLAWLSTPKDERAPGILEHLAKELGVNPKTVQGWRTKLDLDTVAAERARRSLLESLLTVYRALAQKAEEGSHDHMKLYLGVALTTTRRAGRCDRRGPALRGRQEAAARARHGPPGGLEGRWSSQLASPLPVAARDRSACRINLRAVGWSGEQGIEGVINEDRLELKAISIQAKRWKDTVGRPEI